MGREAGVAVSCLVSDSEHAVVMLQVFVVCALLGTADAEPQTETLSKVLSGPRWQIAPEVSYYRYEEPGVMEMDGTLFGVAASYTRYGHTPLFHLEAAFSGGQVDYDGALQDGTSYRMSGIHDYLFNLRLLWGRPWQTEVWEREFCTGIGYRHLNDNASIDPFGYDRESNYFYLPLALRGSRPVKGGWRMGLTGELDILLIGVQVSHLGDVDPSLSTQTNVQWPGFGGRASIEFRRESENLDLAISPFVQYWWIDESSVSSDGWYEPRNNTLQIGMSLIWRF